jgi:hypothetical protein
MMQAVVSGGHRENRFGGVDFNVDSGDRTRFMELAGYAAGREGLVEMSGLRLKPHNT